MVSIDERWDVVNGLLARGRYREIAELCGYTRQHVSGVIQGRRNFTSKSLEEISRAAGVTEEELLAYRRYGSRSVERLAGGTGPHPAAVD